MTGWARGTALLGALLVTAWPATAVAAAEEERATARVLFSFADGEIAESSGLVDDGALVHTVNDSGSGPVLYTVDAGSGETVEVTTWSDDEVEDVEALAPAPDGSVWAGDIGDNFGRRDEVWVYRVRPGSEEAAQRYAFRYPDRPRDAETLLAHPTTGRLFVVTKTVFGGVVHAAPERLREGEVHELRTFAQVPGLLTDGAFLPDGRHVLLRGYAGAALYTFPAFEQVARFELPEQKQGEGLSVGRDGRVLLSSEGTEAEVLELDLPAAAQAALQQGTASGLPGSPAAPPSSRPSGSHDRARDTVAERTADTPWAWWAAGALGVGALAVVLVLVRQHRHP